MRHLPTPATGAPDPPARPLRRTLRRVAFTVAGGAVVAAGVVMLVVPGPGLVTIAVGLSVLGREHAWAARLEQRVRARVVAAARQVRRTTAGARPSAAPAEREEHDEAA